MSRNHRSLAKRLTYPSIGRGRRYQPLGASTGEDRRGEPVILPSYSQRMAGMNVRDPDFRALSVNEAVRIRRDKKRKQDIICNCPSF